MYRVLMLLTVLVAQAIPATAESREKDLDRWMDKDLIPHVRKQLLHHPRFKDHWEAVGVPYPPPEPC